MRMSTLPWVSTACGDCQRVGWLDVGILTLLGTHLLHKRLTTLELCYVALYEGDGASAELETPLCELWWRRRVVVSEHQLGTSYGEGLSKPLTDSPRSPCLNPKSAAAIITPNLIPAWKAVVCRLTGDDGDAVLQCTPELFRINKRIDVGAEARDELRGRRLWLAHLDL